MMTLAQHRRTLSAGAVLALLALAGCGSITGLDGSSEYACKAPVGVKCDSVSGTYHNALQNNLPSQRSRREEPGTAPEKRAPSVDQAPPAAPVMQAISVSTASANRDALREVTPAPIRSQAKVLRLWVKPWEDSDRDLHDQSFVYVQIDSGRWLIDHAQQQIREAFAPVRPPKQSAAGSTPSAAKSGAGATDVTGAAAQAVRALQAATERTPPASEVE